MRRAAEAGVRENGISIRDRSLDGSCLRRVREECNFIALHVTLNSWSADKSLIEPANQITICEKRTGEDVVYVEIVRHRVPRDFMSAYNPAAIEFEMPCQLGFAKGARQSVAEEKGPEKVSFTPQVWASQT